MNLKDRLIRAIKKEDLDEMLLMYRGKSNTNSRLLKYFFEIDPEDRDRIYNSYYNDRTIKKHRIDLLEKIGADVFSGGYTVSDFVTYFPVYRGPEKGLNRDHLYWYTWGIASQVVKLADYDTVIYGENPPLANASTRSDLRKYVFPEIEWFDFNNFYSLAVGPRNSSIRLEQIQRDDNEIKCTGLYNSIFTMCSYLRGLESFLSDLAFNDGFAAELINTVGQISLEYNKKLISKIGSRIDLYAIWDDFAMQSGMMLSPSMWRRFFKPWYEKIIDEALKHNLLIMFHCCGSYHEIVSDLIDLGVNILDPVQSSARDWDLEILHKRYGKHLCFHGGIDTQILMDQKPEEIREEVNRINRVFDNNSGIILGPSAELTPDISIENIMAIYNRNKM